jgi:hypothetical protein
VADRADGLGEMLGPAIVEIVAVNLVTTTCFKPSSATAWATRPGSKASSACGLPVATLQKVQPRVQISPMIIMVAWPWDQHSPTFGQPASSQTVTSFFSRRMSRVSCRPRPWAP